MASGVAVVYGSSGLIGKEVVAVLENHPGIQSIILPVRKINADFSHPSIKQVVVDFDNLAKSKSDLRGDFVFLCLGTTMAKAKSKESFFLVDYTYTCAAATIACELNPAVHLALVSSMGADIRSLFYYSRVKGQVEKTIMEMPCGNVSVFRPSLLLGNRKEKRTGEEWAAGLSKAFPILFKGPLQKYKPIQAADVAKAMVIVTLQTRSEKSVIFPSHEMGIVAQKGFS